MKWTTPRRTIPRLSVRNWIKKKSDREMSKLVRMLRGMSYPDPVDSSRSHEASEKEHLQEFKIMNALDISVTVTILHQGPG